MMITITRKNSRLGNYLHYNHQAEARDGGFEQILTGYRPVQTGVDEGTSEPIYEDEPVYSDGDPLFAADWDEAWGEPPSDDDLAAWEEPEPEPNPVTDVEKEAMEKAAPAKALIVEDAMAARATLATAREKASGAKDLGEVKEAVQVLAEALDAVLAKMQGEQKK